MKKMSVILIVALLAMVLVGCNVREPEMVSIDVPTVITITGAGSLDHANIVMTDADGVTHEYANAALPYSYSGTYSSGDTIYAWAQNTTADFSSSLTLSIVCFGTPRGGDASRGLYCTVGYSWEIPYFED